MVPVVRPGGIVRRRRARADRRDLRRRRPAGRRLAGRRLLLRPAEELRRRRRAVAGAAQPGGAGADRGGSHASERWIPEFLSLQTALENSRKDQTYNTPAVATLFLLADQIRWMLDGGGLDWCVARTRAVLASTSTAWAEAHALRDAVRRRCRPSARWSSARSTSTRRSTRRRSRRRCAPTGSSTSSPTASSGATSCAIGMFPAVEPADVRALTACIDWVAGAGSAVSARGDALARVLVKEKIGDSGVDAAARALRRRARRRLDARAARPSGSATTTAS